MFWRRKFSLLSGAVLLAACASSPPAKPGIPDSVSPGWKLMSLTQSSSGDPVCWKANYSGEGTAQASICWYNATASAFEATQRTPAEAQSVKFQQEHYFVLVTWNNTPKANLSALVRALEKSLGGSHG